MVRALRRSIPWVFVLLLAACGTSGPASSPTPTGPSPSPTPSPAPSPSPAPAPAACSASIGNLPQTVPAKAGAYAFSVAIGAGCAWTTSTDVNWADADPASGIGAATPQLRVSEHTRFDSRTLTLTINGQAFAIRQEGYACTYALSDAAFDARNEGGEFTVRVTAPAGCRWSVTSTTSWITVRTANGAGSDYAYFTVASNTGDARSGFITIAGQRVNITQARG
jgi:hypothetical protein